jgi:integrase
MARRRITAAFVEGVKPPVDRPLVDYYDELVTGFHLRVFRSGKKSWMVYYRTSAKKQRRMELGRYPIIELADARQKAKDALKDVTAGIDPLEVRREVEEWDGEPRHTLAGAANEFIERHCMVNNKRWEERRRIFDVYVLPDLGERDIREIRRSDIRDLVRKIESKQATLTNGRKGGGHVMANRTAQAVKALYNWLIKEDRVEMNPASLVAADRHEQASDRFLSDAEIRALWSTVDKWGSVYVPIVKLCAITGQRIGEVCAMRRVDLDQDRQVWTIPETKNELPHEVPLPDLALEVLADVPIFGDGRGWVFPSHRGATHVTTSTTNAKKKLDELMLKELDGVDLEPWVFHV